MELWLQLVIGAAIVLTLAAAAYLFVTVYVAKRKGYYSRNRMGRCCRAMAHRGGHTYMRDLVLPIDGKSVRIDHLVVGTFGLVLVNCYDYRGDLYGARGDKNWYVYGKDNKTRKTVSNPLPRMDASIAAIRAVFAKEGVYRVTNVDQMVVYGNDVKLNVSRSDKDPVEVYRLRSAKAPLRQPKYLLDGPVDVRKASEALEKCRVK